MNRLRWAVSRAIVLALAFPAGRIATVAIIVDITVGIITK
jgi:hypothetical protein